MIRDPIPPGHGEPWNVAARPGIDPYCGCGRPLASQPLTNGRCVCGRPVREEQNQ